MIVTGKKMQLPTIFPSDMVFEGLRDFEGRGVSAETIGSHYHSIYV
jgi:hypothetical protein